MKPPILDDGYSKLCNAGVHPVIAPEQLRISDHQRTTIKTAYICLIILSCSAMYFGLRLYPIAWPKLDPLVNKQSPSCQFALCKLFL